MEGVTMLLQSKAVLKTLDQSSVLAKDDPNRGANQAEASTLPRMQKLDEMTAAVAGVKELLGGGASPGVVELIDQMIKIIEDLKEKVKIYQESTQTKLDTRITTLTDRTENAVKEKNEADQYDKSYDQCISEEQQLLVAHETCKSE